MAKLTRKQRGEISRKNLRKAFAARGVKATFEPKRKTPKRRVSSPTPAFVFEPMRHRTVHRVAEKQATPSQILAEFEKMQPKKEASVAKKKVSKKTSKKPSRKPSKKNNFSAVKRSIAKRQAAGGKRTGSSVDRASKARKAAAAASKAKKPSKKRVSAKKISLSKIRQIPGESLRGQMQGQVGRPRVLSALLKHPRKAHGPKHGLMGHKVGRPRLSNSKLKHPRKAKSPSGGYMPKFGRRGQGIAIGQYANQAGQVIAIKRIYGKRNPIWETKYLAAAGGGLILGVIGADLLDRFLATLATTDGGDALHTEDAIKAIRSKASAVRMASSAGGAVVGFGSAYLLRNKSAIASYALSGLGLGFGVKFLTTLVTDVLMPVVFKADSKSNELLSNRLYPDKQDYAGLTAGSTQGVGAAPRVYRLPAPVTRQVRDLGPTATRKVGTAGTVGCGGGCGGSCGGNCGAEQGQRAMQSFGCPTGGIAREEQPRRIVFPVPSKGFEYTETGRVQETGLTASLPGTTVEVDTNELPSGEVVVTTKKVMNRGDLVKMMAERANRGSPIKVGLRGYN